MSKTKKMYIGIVVFILYLILPMLMNSFLTPISESAGVDYILRAICYSFILVLFIFIYRKDFKTYWKEFTKNKGKNIKNIVIYLLLSLVIMFLCSFVVYILFPDINYTNDDIIMEYFSSTMWFTIFAVVFYTPIVEEIVFRKTFRDIIKSKWFYVIFSSLVFAFYHVGYNFTGISSILGMIPYFGLGVVLAISYYKSESIYVPIIVHILYDVFVMFINFG